MSKQSLGRVAMVPKGAYSALTAYKRLDVVTHDGASYIVLRPVQGVPPVDGEDYMLLVQDGDTPDLSVGTVDTLEAGSKATASIGGTADKPELNLGIPKGDTGAAPKLKMGKVTTLEPGSEASASLSGTVEEPELNLNIPRGASGGVDVASAQVGQTIIVKAVDDNGKPTEWEAKDMAGGENFHLVAEVTTEETVRTLEFPFADQKLSEIIVNIKPSAEFKPDNAWFRFVDEIGALLNFAHVNTVTIGADGLFVNAKIAGDSAYSVACPLQGYMWTSSTQYAFRYDRRRAGEWFKIRLDFYVDIPVGTQVQIFAR